MLIHCSWMAQVAVDPNPLIHIHFEEVNMDKSCSFKTQRWAFFISQATPLRGKPQLDTETWGPIETSEPRAASARTPGSWQTTATADADEFRNWNSEVLNEPAMIHGFCNVDSAWFSKKTTETTWNRTRTIWRYFSWPHPQGIQAC